MVDQGYRARLEEIPTLPENTQPTTQVLKKWLQAHHDEGDIAHGQFEADLSALELEVFQQARIQELPAHHDLPTFFEEKLKQWQGAKNGLAKLNDDIAKAEAAGDHETLVQLLKAKSEALRSKE
jgi:hypothetical protein